MKRINSLWYLSFLILLSAIETLTAGTPRLSLFTIIHEEANISAFLETLIHEPFFQESELLLMSNQILPTQEKALTPYLTSYTNIHFFKATDPTIAYAALFNELLTHTQGTYLMHASIEDSFNNEGILSLMKELEENLAVDVVYGACYASFSPNTAYGTKPLWYGINPPEFDPFFLSYNLVGHQCMWRKRMHQQYGFFNEHFKYLYFWEYWNRAASQGASFKKVPIISGNSWVGYANPRSFFYRDLDSEHWYHEDKLIRSMYQHQWKTDLKKVPEKPFVIITASYNNKKWYKRNLDSLLSQRYTNYRIIYIDDNSPDNTGAYVQDYIQEHQQKNRITLLRNTQRQGALANIYRAAHLCKPEEIILIVDGDDWLAHDDVLTYLNLVYQNPEVWLTYGQFAWFPGELAGFCVSLPSSFIEENKFRQCWVTSHLRTFYAALFHRIKKEDLQYNNHFFASAGDVAIMYPMLEMAGKHSRFIPYILYIYNNATHLNDHKVDQNLQVAVTAHIAQQEPYKPLETLF